MLRIILAVGFIAATAAQAAPRKPIDMPAPSMFDGPISLSEMHPGFSDDELRALAIPILRDELNALKIEEDRR